jgi:peptide chain release factor 1
MIDKLEAIRARFEDLGVALTNPSIVNDNRKFTQLSKEYRNLETIVKAYSDYKQILEISSLTAKP